MPPRFLWSATLLCIVLRCPAQAPFTVVQALQAPFASSLVGSPDTAQFAWVEAHDGRQSLWIASPGEPARALMRDPDDDGEDLRDLMFLPGGKALAYTRGPETGADGKPANAAHLQPPPSVQVWLVRTAGQPAAPVLVGEGHSPLPAPDEQHLLFVRGGQVWIADTETAAGHAAPSPASAGLPAHQLVFDRGSASQLALSPDGNLLAFVSRRDRSHSFLALFDLRKRLLSFPAASTGNDSAPAFSPDGGQLAWLRSPWTDAPEFAANRTSPNPWSIQLLAVASGAVRTPFAPEANRPGSVLPHISSGEPRLLWASALPGHAAGPALIFASEADGWVHLYGLPANAPAGAAPTLLTPLPGEAEDPVVSPDGKVLLYSSRGPASTCGGGAACTQSVSLPENVDRRTVWKLDLTQAGEPAAAAPFPLPLTPPTQIATHPAMAAGDVAAALISDAHVPSHPALLSRVTATQAHMDAASPATPLRAAWLPKEYPGAAFVQPQPVLFRSADKLFDLHGQLFLPAATQGKTAARRPAILFFHGGPRRQMLLGYPSMEYYSRAYALNQYFAAQGFIVLSVNYRGGVGYGLDFREAAHTGADGAAEYNDVLGAVTYLRSRPDVDSARIGLWGGSYGGYLTALALARNSDLFAAGVDYHGVHDWIIEDNRADWLRGTPAEQAAIAARAHASSPLADVGKWKSPVLLIHGDNDGNVAYAQTPVLADALRARGVPVEELIFPDEIHEFLLYRDWLRSYRATATFLEEHLQPQGATQTSARETTNNGAQKRR